MTTRERILAGTVLTVIVLAGLAFLFYQLYVVPMDDKAAGIRLLEEEVRKQEERLAQWQKDKARLDRWKRLSLPPDTDLARREYEKYLSHLFADSGFAADAFTVRMREADSKGGPTLAGKKPIYTRLGFSVTGHGSLESIVKVQESFYRTPLLHQVKSFSIRRPLTVGPQSKPGELDLDLGIEALIFHDAEPRTTLLPGIDRRLLAADVVAGMRRGPTGLGTLLHTVGPVGPLGPGVLARAPGEYISILDKNVFMGRPPVVADSTEDRGEPLVEESRFTFLTDITRTDRRTEATMYDRYNNRITRLRASPGFNRFSLLQAKDGSTILHGTVVRIEEREVIFRVTLNATDAESSVSRRYRDPEVIYRLHPDDVAFLVKEESIKESEGNRVYRVDPELWDNLAKERVVRSTGENFVFRWDLMSGRILERDDTTVLICLDEKYCSYRGEQTQRRPRPHTGFCVFEVGQPLSEALEQSISEEEAMATAEVNAR